MIRLSHNMKRENIMTNLEQINADMAEYFAMQDRLQILRDYDAISQREYAILATTIDNRLHDFTQSKREALIEEITDYLTIADHDSLYVAALRNKYISQLVEILEQVKKAA